MVNKLSNFTVATKKEHKKKDKMEMPKERSLLGKSRGPRIMSGAVIHESLFTYNREMPFYLLLVVNELLEEGV